jgi:predicted peptidase
VPEKINELAGLVTDNIRGRLSEITYTFRGSKISMETLVGNRDIQQIKNPVGEEVFQLVYDESEYYNYVLYLPQGYDPKDKTKKWPVIYFLHGIGEKGDDLTKLLDYGVPRYIMETGSLDAIMIAPQCPGDSHWADTDVEEPRLKAFVEENNEKYNINADRIYLTGLSMGGRGTWKQALAMPDTFAAIAVVCGRTNTYDFSGILDMPIWMFHGAVDDTVAFQNVNRIVEELYSQGQKYFKLTVYPYLSHDSWTSAYARPDLYEWLLSQNLKNRE